MPNNSPRWGDPGVTESQFLQETAIAMPSAAGGNVTRTLQRAGFLKRLRMYSNAHLNVSAYTSGSQKSTKGPLGAWLSRIQIAANGNIPLVDMSGLMAQMYNEVQNRDGSVVATPSFISNNGFTAGANLWQYDAITGTGDVYAKFPFEFQFALPMNIQGYAAEIGLWLLQNQAIDVGVTASFNPLYAASASVDALWSAGTLTAGSFQSDNQIQIERELYSVPANPGSYPDTAWAHQVVEYSVPFTGKFSRFQIPRSGLLLRALVYTEDTNAAAVEYTDVSNMAFIYGSNDTPIARPGWALMQEYLQDYGRYAPKGVQVLDFYKWGEQGLKLVKSTEDLANLRIETTYASTSSGTQRIVLDRLIPVVTRPGA